MKYMGIYWTVFAPLMKKSIAKRFDRELAERAFDDRCAGKPPDADKIILVMDNLNTHSTGSLYKVFSPAEARRIAKKLENHYTLKHESWLNIAEIGINIMTRECPGRRIESLELLTSELAAWNAAYDQDPSPINWQFQTNDSRIKLKKLYPNIDRMHEERGARALSKTSTSDKSQSA